MENIKEIFASFGLWSLVEDISDDGDGIGDDLQLTKEGEEARRMIDQEIEKAREEGRRENYNAQLEEIEMSRNEERKRTLTEVIKLFDARREEGLSEMWVVDEIAKRLKVIKLKDNK